MVSSSAVLSPPCSDSAASSNTFADGRAESMQEPPMFTLMVAGDPNLACADLVWNPLFWAVQKHRTMIVRHFGADDRPGTVGVDAFTTQWCNLPGHEWNQSPDPERLVIEQLYDAVDAMVAAGASALYVFPEGGRRSRCARVLAAAWCAGIPCVVWSTKHVGRYRTLSEHDGELMARRVLGYGS